MGAERSQAADVVAVHASVADGEPTATSVAGVADRAPTVAFVADRLARIAFGLAIVLSPFRAQVLLVPRPTPPLYSAYTDLAISWSGIAVLAALASWLVALAASRRPVSFGPSFVRWPAAALLAIAWLTLPWSKDPDVSAFDAARLVVLAGFALFVLNEIRGIADLAIPVAVTVVVEGIVAIAQAFMQRSVGLGGLGELSLDPLKAGTSVVSTTGADRLLRAYGLTDHPNILGGILAAALPIVMAGLLGARPGASARSRTWRQRGVFVAFGIAAVLDVVALFLTFSRGAWLAAAVALAIAAVVAARARRRSLARWGSHLAVAGGMVAVAAVVAVAVVAATGLGRFVAARAGLDGVQPVTEQMSLGERPILVTAAARVFMDHPLTGVGLGALPATLRAANPSLTFDAQPAPNVEVDAAAETGAVGGLAYLALLAAPWVVLPRRRRSLTSDLAIATAVVAAVEVVGLFDYYTWAYTAGLIWAWLALGLWAGAFVRATAGVGADVPHRAPALPHTNGVASPATRTNSPRSALHEPHVSSAPVDAR